MNKKNIQRMQGIRLTPSLNQTALSTYIQEDGVYKAAYGKIPIPYEQLVQAAKISLINREDFCIDPTGVNVEILRETGSGLQVEFIFPPVLSFMPGVELTLEAIKGQQIGQFTTTGETILKMRVGHHVLPIVKATHAGNDMWETFVFPKKHEDVVDDEGLRQLLIQLAKSHRSEEKFFAAREEFVNGELNKLFAELGQ